MHVKIDFIVRRRTILSLFVSTRKGSGGSRKFSGPRITVEEDENDEEEEEEEEEDKDETEDGYVSDSSSTTSDDLSVIEEERDGAWQCLL